MEKGAGNTFEHCRALLSHITTNKISLPTYLDSEFHLSMTNSSRVTEKGCGSTFELCHTLLIMSCKTINRIKLSTYIQSFNFLGRMTYCKS